MKYRIHILLIVSIVLLGGCGMSAEEEVQKPSEMNPEDLPDERAFQDEFTRDFLQSTEESRPGYYPFLSGTGKYEMDFPAGGVIGEKGYSARDAGLESYLIGVEYEDGGQLINVSYNSIRDKENEEFHLKSIEQNLDENLNFEKITLEDRTIYLAESSTDNDSYYFIGYIQNQEDVGGVEMTFDIDGNVIDEFNNLEKEIKNLLKSVEFIDKESE